MDNIELLKEDLRWEFIGSEKDFEEHIYEHMHDIIECLGLPKIKASGRQKQIRFGNSQIIMDILLRHVDGTATIIEVKKPNSKNKWVSPHAQMQAIGQLLLYRNVLEAKISTKPRLILIDNKIHERTYLSFIGNKLPITLLEFQKDRLFMPYNALAI